MPRFLDTTTGRFRWVADPATVTYAILSHTWRSETEGSEQPYEEVRRIEERVKHDRLSKELSAWSDDRDEASFLGHALKSEATSDLLSPDMVAQLWQRVKILEARLSVVTTSTTTDVAGESILAHPDLSDKIKGICRIAREAGYQLIWIDSACIDKSSSAELSEAINSMFNLYRLADVCYVYLADVPDGALRRMAFGQSRWHRRGWTLQELLAPKDVVFLTASWTVLGTKHGLATMLSSVTGIDSDVLLGKTPLSEVSVARRFSWAAQRETTRVEDEAYSLLGIFGVSLSSIYGEGRNAFLRLQEEIIRTIPDQTIFAWGAMRQVESLENCSVTSQSPVLPVHNGPTGLLALSPREFAGAGDFRPLSTSGYLSLLAGRTHDESTAQIRDVPPLRSFVTPEGIRIKAHTFDLSAPPKGAAPIVLNNGLFSSVHRDNCPSGEKGRVRTLAILRCIFKSDMLVTLALFQPPIGTNNSEGLPIATHVTCTASDRYPCTWHYVCRVVCLGGKALDALLKNLSPAPVELSLLHHSTLSPAKLAVWFSYPVIDIFRDALSALGYAKNDDSKPAPIELAPSCATRLAALGYGICPLYNASAHIGEVVAQTAVFRTSSAASNMTPQTHIHISLSLTLGRDPRQSTSSDTRIGARFSISVHFPRATNEVGSDRLPVGDTALARGPCNCAFYPGGCEAFPLTTDDPSRTVFASKHVRLPERVVAQAEFFVPASLNGPRREGTGQRQPSRILRLAVECPLDYCRYDVKPRPFITDLWLAVDLTDVIEVDRDPRLLQ